MGFRAVDRFVARNKGVWKKAPIGEGLAAHFELAGRQLRVAKPFTFMNESGRMVGEFARFFKIPADGTLVVSDDIDLPLGALRIRLKGSSGGQRGLESVLGAFKTAAVPRIRLGVGPRPARFDAADFVLSRFGADEEPAVDDMVERASDAIAAAVSAGLETAMNRFNKVPG